MELENVFEDNADCITINHLHLMFDLLDYWSDVLFQYRILDRYYYVLTIQFQKVICIVLYTLIANKSPKYIYILHLPIFFTE